MNPNVTVMRSRFVRSWPKHEQGEWGYTLPLSKALQRVYASDACMAQYVSTLDRRLSSKAIGRVPIALSAIAFDLDCEAVHGTAEPAPQAWRDEQYERCCALSVEHPDPFVYFTKAGMRIVYTIEPSVLNVAEDAKQWTREYLVILAALERQFGIVGDAACADWTRLFRLPHVVRDRDGKPEAWPTFGDPERIGVLSITPTSADVETASERSRVFREAQRREFEPYVGDDGRGLLFHALDGRRDIGARRDDGAFSVRCPNEAQHTSGETSDGSTRLYLPAHGSHVGWLHCLHSHCSGFDARDWLRFFSDAELQRAEQAAGLAKGRAA